MIKLPPNTNSRYPVFDDHNQIQGFLDFVFSERDLDSGGFLFHTRIDHESDWTVPPTEDEGTKFQKFRVQFDKRACVEPYETDRRVKSQCWVVICHSQDIKHLYELDGTYYTSLPGLFGTTEEHYE